MGITLHHIPDVEPEWEQSHRVRALVIDGKSPVLTQLAQWKSSEPADYKKIMRVMERVARLDRVKDEKHVRADGAKSDIFEMRAHRGKARVFFFYDNDQTRTAICVHTFWKGSGNQSKAFEQAATMMALWRSRNRRQ